MTVQDPPTRTAHATGATALYCYGVVPAAAAREQPAGVGEAPVGAVCFGDLAALTSPIAAPGIRARRRDLMSHSEVLTNAIAGSAVLPLRFGTVFESEDALVSSFLRPRHDELVDLLRRFDGLVELSVKAFFREEAILAEIVRDNPRIARLRDETGTRPAAATYGARIELGELVAAELQRRSAQAAEEILARLRPLALEIETDDEPVEHRVLQASFLVDRERVPRFDREMDELAGSERHRMHFKYLGPLPPHSFVALEQES